MYKRKKTYKSDAYLRCKSRERTALYVARIYGENFVLSPCTTSNIFNQTLRYADNIFSSVTAVIPAIVIFYKRKTRFGKTVQG